jgi:hypothetical protein
MDYRIATAFEYWCDAVDPLAAEQSKGRLLTKVGALACFLLAGVLLVASLLVPPPAPAGVEKGAPPGHTASTH